MAPEDEVYARIGEEGFARLVAGFYRRVASDDLLGPMYPRHDLTGAEQRLCEFLVFRFGGPQRYIARRGHPRLRGGNYRAEGCISGSRSDWKSKPCRAPACRDFWQDRPYPGTGVLGFEYKVSC